MGMPSWLENIVFYETYPQTFLDTDGDGIGNIQGIIRKLDYIKNLGCDGIWLNPCFASPFYDAGYDVSDRDILLQIMNGSENPVKQRKMNIQTVMYGPMIYGMISKM